MASSTVRIGCKRLELDFYVPDGFGRFRLRLADDERHRLALVACRRGGQHGLVADDRPDISVRRRSP